jgi:pimeloyl-ACP methyl ester carboxylesterase
MAENLAIETFRNASDQLVRAQLHLPSKSLFGPKPPVKAYVHGMGGCMDSMATVRSMENVREQGYAVWRYDATPVRKTDDSPFGFKADTRKFSPKTCVQTLHKSLQTLEERHSHQVDMSHLALHGSSFGALGSFWYAAHNNDKFQRRLLPEGEESYPIMGLITQSPVIDPLGTAPKWLIEDPLFNFFWKACGSLPRLIVGEICWMDHGIREDCYGMDFLRDIAPYIQQPVRVDFGKADPLLDPKMIERFTDVMPQVEICAYEGSGHALEMVEALDALKEEQIRPYLTGGRKWLRRRPERLIEFMLKNFESATHGPKAIEAGCGFLQKLMQPQLNTSSNPGHEERTLLVA